jgi:hypothetical protein
VSGEPRARRHPLPIPIPCEEHGFRGCHACAADKPTNPKDAIGSDKLPLHLWPSTATIYGALGLLEGALKYGRSNFRAVGIRASIYIDALLRHTYALAEGEDYDPDSGLPHEAHILACAAIIVEARTKGNMIDDRSYPTRYRELVDQMTPHVARLKAKYQDRNPKHYTIQDDNSR